MPISTSSVKRSLLVVVVLLWASAFALAAEHAASGAITHNGKTMNLRAGVAVWNAAENQLRIALLPFEPTAAEVREIRKSGAVFVAAERPSPNPSVWERPPFAELIINFAPGITTAGLQAVTHYRLDISWLDRMNHTSSPNRNSQEEARREFQSLSGSLRDSGSLRLAIKGAETIFDDKLDWNFRVDATIGAGR